MLAAFAIICGSFIAMIASMPLRLSFWRVQERRWSDAFGYLVVGVMLAGIAVVMFTNAISGALN